jgi:hypothetical protein
MFSPSTPQKPISPREENKPISTETSKEEPAADPTMLTIAKVIKFHINYYQKTFFSNIRIERE